MLSSDAKADSQWTVYPSPRGDEYSGTVYPVPIGDEIPGTVYPVPRGDEIPGTVYPVPRGDEIPGTVYPRPNEILPADLDAETMATLRDGIFHGKIIG
jgi:hypothetical protein